MLRFLVNRSMVLKNWDAGTNEYKKCSACDTAATREHFMLECSALNDKTQEFFSRIREVLDKIFSKKQHRLKSRGE